MPKASSLSQEYKNAAKHLKIVAALVAIYGLGLNVNGEAFAISLFDLLNFGPNSKGLSESGVSYALFAFGILGAVIMGWMALIWFMVDLATVEDYASVRAMARKGLAISTVSWFLFDTGFSLALGEVEHAAFNLPFVTLLGVPLYRMHVHDVEEKKQS
jgi:hypothetical protein